jgi:hypothetical protein
LNAKSSCYGNDIYPTNPLAIPHTTKEEAVIMMMCGRCLQISGVKGLMVIRIIPAVLTSGIILLLLFVVQLIFLYVIS